MHLTHEDHTGNKLKIVCAILGIFDTGIYYMNSIVLKEGSLEHLHEYTFKCIHIYMYTHLHV